MIQLSPAAPQRHARLSVYPLLSPAARSLGCDLLVDAIRAGTLTITEFGSGTVPELAAINEGDRDVLILDGEQFIGARQNRMAGRSILLPAGSKTTIPVSCMEQGRWHSVGDRFAPSPVHSPASVRAPNRRRESDYARMGRAADPNVLKETQREVWNAIAHFASDIGESSSTGALDEVVGRKAKDLDAWVGSFPSLPGQVGLLAFLGGDPVGLDVVGDPDLYARLHRRLVGGYVQDALRVRDIEGDPDPEAAEGYLGLVGAATRTEAPTVGAGVYRVLTGEVVGGELVEKSGTIHLSAFPPREELREESPGPRSEGPIIPGPSRRHFIR